MHTRPRQTDRRTNIMAIARRFVLTNAPRAVMIEKTFLSAMDVGWSLVQWRFWHLQFGRGQQGGPSCKHGGRGPAYHYFYVTNLCKNRVTNVDTGILVLRKTVVTCEIKLFCNNFEIISVFYHATCNHVWNWNEIISAAEIILKLFQRHWTCWKIFVSWNKLLK